MPASKPKGLFVTGTDTGVGKTVVAGALCRHLAAKGLDVGVIKPAETGVDDPTLLGPDAELLRWASGSKDGTDEICPYRLKAPVAPAVAASSEQIRINYTDLVDRARSLIARHDFTIVEGAGGLMVPLAGGILMADLARELELPLLVVARPNLGTINHTLLTLMAARTMEITVAGYLINRMPAKPDIAEKQAPHSLASLTTEDLLGVLEEVAGSDREKINRLAEQIENLPTRPLLNRFLSF